ncbi:MAG: ThiF family adenylyltransferase [Cyanobacteria bacterium J06607_15]
MTTASLTIQEQHLNQIHQEHPIGEQRVKEPKILFCGTSEIAGDPWKQESHLKFISHQILTQPKSCESFTHSFVEALSLAKDKSLTPALVYSCPDNDLSLIAQTEAEARRLVQQVQEHNNFETKLLTILQTPSSKLSGRLWLSERNNLPLSMIRVVGDSIRLHYADRGNGVSSLVSQRQALAFGKALNQDLSMLRIGIVGCGGTGSAVAMLLARLKVGYVALFDPDIVEDSNLNRLHGARQADADAMKSKVEVVARSITEIGLGVKVVGYQNWIGDTECRDALKSCDLIFGCTDDHSGRIMLNRFAYYYVTPLIDMGLAIDVGHEDIPTIKALDGRVTVVGPNHTCLMCHGVVNPTVAHCESLKRLNPNEYERQKAEAYIIGEGNPSPAVVTFTTDVASMAVQEMLHRLQGFRGENGAVANRVRKFGLMSDRRQSAKPHPDCPLCARADSWGRGDIEPFLDLVG